MLHQYWPWALETGLYLYLDWYPAGSGHRDIKTANPATAT